MITKRGKKRERERENDRETEDEQTSHLRLLLQKSNYLAKRKKEKSTDGAKKIFPGFDIKSYQ